MILLALFFFAPQISQAEDCWISVSGSGSKNGKNSSNAYSASEGKAGKNAQICWNQTGPDGTMHVLEGDYTVENGAFWKLQITSANDGSSAPEGNFKKLTGEGRVHVRGPRRVPYAPSMKEEGGRWISIGRNAGRIRIQNFYVSRVAEGVTAKEGGNSNLQFRDLYFEDTRENFTLFGHPDCTGLLSCPQKPDELSRDILIENTWSARYSKRHVRLSRGISRVQVVNSHADAGFLDGDFAVGFDVENPSHDIEFNHCSARANLYSLSNYWNGDGFKSENETKNIRWLNCSAFDNADAGFDIKTENATLENIIAMGNNRNIRIWSSETATVKNAIASYAKHRGGEGSEAGIWSAGAVDCHFCTLHNNRIQVLAENNEKAGWIRLYDSILSADTPSREEWILQESGSRVDLIRTVQWKRDTTGLDPKFGLGATAHWEGDNREFNNLLYGKMKGYHYE